MPISFAIVEETGRKPVSYLEITQVYCYTHLKLRVFILDVPVHNEQQVLKGSVLFFADCCFYIYDKGQYR